MTPDAKALEMVEAFRPLAEMKTIRRDRYGRPVLCTCTICGTTMDDSTPERKDIPKLKKINGHAVEGLSFSIAGCSHCGHCMARTGQGWRDLTRAEAEELAASGEFKRVRKRVEDRMHEIGAWG